MQSFWFCKPTMVLRLCIQTQTKNNLFASSKPCGSRCTSVECYIYMCTKIIKSYFFNIFYPNDRVTIIVNMQLIFWHNDLISIYHPTPTIFKINMIKEAVNINAILLHVRTWARKGYEMKVTLTFNGIQFYRLTSRVWCLSNAFTFHLFKFPFFVYFCYLNIESWYLHQVTKEWDCCNSICNCNSICKLFCNSKSLFQK